MRIQRNPEKPLRQSAAEWVAIVSKRGDPHALLVGAALKRSGKVCHIIESDLVGGGGSLSWRPGVGLLCIQNSEGKTIRLDGAGTIWWRRGARQKSADHRTKSGVLTSRNASAALTGSILCLPLARIVDDPFAVSMAENKLVQLQAAEHCGLRMPETLVSSNPDEIRDFAKMNGGSIVAKTLRHLPNSALESIIVGTEELTNSEALAVAPTIYQEIVRGEVHARALVFGDRVNTVRLTSPHFDWRGRKELAAEPINLPEAVERQLIALLQSLGLSMAVADFKYDGDVPVFLEINPQGQFLFMQLLAGQDWLDDFAAFLSA